MAGHQQERHRRRTGGQLPDAITGQRLHRSDDVGVTEHVVADLCAGVDVVGVVDLGLSTGTGLDGDLVAETCQLPNAVGDDRDAGFPRLGLRDDGDSHEAKP
jgi:hypothetical protein